MVATDKTYPKTNGLVEEPVPDVILMLDFRCTTGLAARALLARLLPT